MENSASLVPAPRSPSPRVLLIQSEWPARALLKAQLEAEGCDVIGADSVGTALDFCVKRGFRPTVIVLDAVGLSSQAADLHLLPRLRSGAPLIALVSTHLDLPLINALSPTMLLKRPFSIGDVVTAVLES